MSNKLTKLIGIDIIKRAKGDFNDMHTNEFQTCASALPENLTTTTEEAIGIWLADTIVRAIKIGCAALLVLIGCWFVAGIFNAKLSHVLLLYCLFKTTSLQLKQK